MAFDTNVKVAGTLQAIQTDRDSDRSVNQQGAWQHCSIGDQHWGPAEDLAEARQVKH